ncbi:hypothetical protein [Dictyobacter kobayashii]|uniref:LamG-like jellyroll fold domain-containing protein n=1 Tax=Dictyobacter kobayashii TaxID=2014872 RepID=A0A402ATT4_9CHLR|nr:hypothetical protein [Dictyobacter kobayashii]GCE22507.1 hypothetical protein KDK_63070 [Dictyobacter kobayashii]
MWNRNDSDFVNGTLDEVRFYQSALSDSQIATLYNTNNQASVARYIDRHAAGRSMCSPLLYATD